MKIKGEFSPEEIEDLNIAVLDYRLRLEKEFEKAKKNSRIKNVNGKRVITVNMKNGGSFTDFTTEEIENRIKRLKNFSQEFVKEARYLYL